MIKHSININTKVLYRAKWAWSTTATAKRVFAFCRWLHIYMSSALFALLIFFCVTGITLNHLAWFDDKGAQKTSNVNLPPQLLQTLERSFQANAQWPLKSLQQFVSDTTGLQKADKINIDNEVGEITFDYSLPAGYTFVTIFIEQGEMEVDSKTGSFVALINDLHKGRHTGQQWSWLIDSSAILIVLFSITGLVILLQNHKHRVTGLLLCAMGTALPFVAYLLFVPKAA